MIIINGFDSNTAAKLRSKLNGLLTERQKKEIYDKIMEMDQNQLQQLISNSNIGNMSEQQLMSIINSVSKEELLNKLKRL